MKSRMNIVSNPVIHDYKGLQFRLMISTVQLAIETLRPYQNVCHPCSSACITCCSSRSCGQTSKCNRQFTAPSNDSLERSDDGWLSEMYPFECGCSKRLVSVKLTGSSAETHVEAKLMQKPGPQCQAKSAKHTRPQYNACLTPLQSQIQF
jgi:hypothetical protein